MKKAIIYFEDENEKIVKYRVRNFFITGVIKSWEIKEHKGKVGDMK